MREKSDELYAQQVRAALEPIVAPSEFWREAICLTRIDSTNTLAKTLASQGAPEGTLVVADEQTAGRGRLNRRWIAAPGTSLLCSILFRPALSASRVNHLTMLCSMAAADAVEQVAGLPVGLKWPNDLVVKSQSPHLGRQAWRKLAGILTETSLLGNRVAFAIVGIGINVNMLPEALPRLAPHATSILAETRRRTDRLELLLAVLKCVETRYEHLKSGDAPYQEWSTRLATLGQHVKVRTAQGVLHGTAEAVDVEGALLLKTDDGHVRRLLAGDVTLADA